MLGVLAYAPAYHAVKAIGLVRISGDAWRSYLATMAIAPGTMVLPFSTLLFGHALAAACLVGAFLMAAAWRRSDRPGRAGYFAGVGLLLGFAVLTEYTSLLGAVPVLLYVFASRVVEPRRALSRAPAVALLTGFAIPLAVYAAYTMACFGSPLSIGYTYEADEAFRATHAVGVVGVSRPRLDVLYYLTFHPIRGIFLQSPVLRPVADLRPVSAGTRARPLHRQSRPPRRPAARGQPVAARRRLAGHRRDRPPRRPARRYAATRALPLSL